MNPTLRVLEAGAAAATVLIAIALWTAARTRGETSAPRRLVLRAFAITIGVLIIEICAAADHTGLAFWSVAPVLTWLICTFLVPMWTDNSEIVEDHEPDTGWKCLFGTRMLYADRRNPAVWVRMRNPIPISTDMGYTPNLGNFWGRLVIAMLFVTLTASMAVLAAA